MDYIISPIVTEKTTLMMEKENKITFLVNRKATKEAIKNEVESRFDVKVTKVNIMIAKNGKKAIVTLAKEFSAEDVGGRMGIF